MSYDSSLFSAQLPIETSESREYRQWAEQLGTTPEAVRDAVRQVGYSADAVRRLILGQGQS